MTTKFQIEGQLPPHEYVSSRHCRDCMVGNIRRNREQTGGWAGVCVSVQKSEM